MAITKTFNVSFAMTAGFSTAQVGAVAKARTELHKSVDKQGLEVILAQRPKDEHHIIKAMLDSQKSNEEIIVLGVKASVRDALKELTEDDKEGNFLRIGDISTKVRGPVEAITECPRCSLNTTCPKIAVAGCKAVLRD